ncbi:MAG: glycosyltransferase family 4 protein, partial [Candidatus Woesebacteria bacterium]|nr:glycosyltransferase family 4 protein [Candidatus Woesebacteria bacterium]
MKIALVYDRVNKWGGAERVLLTLHEMFPDAPLYTSVYDEASTSWAKVFPKIYTSFLQRIPFAKSNHELFGWLMPLAFETFNFDMYDLVISITSEAAKGIITKPKTKHICYCLTPTRYLWSHYDLYFKNKLFRFISKPFINYLRNWDKVAAQRPDQIIAISTEVKNRIKKYYNRDAEVIFPPVSLHHKKYLSKNHAYYLIVSRLVPYKRV